MTDRSTSTDRGEAFVQSMTDQMATVARTLRAWVQAETRPLQEIETQVVRVLHDVGNALLVALLPLTASARPRPDVRCACGALASYERMRSASDLPLNRAMPAHRYPPDARQLHAPPVHPKAVPVLL